MTEPTIPEFRQKFIDGTPAPTEYTDIVTQMCHKILEIEEEVGIFELDN